MLRPSLQSSASRRAIGRNLALDLLVAVGMGVTMALVSSILPTVARRGGLEPLGLSALAAAPFVANLLGAFAGRFGPRNTAQLALTRGLGAASLLVLFLVPPAPVVVAVAIVFWLSLSFGGPFHLRLWGAMYPARLRGRVVGVLGMGRAAAGALAAFGGGVLADRHRRRAGGRGRGDHRRRVRGRLCRAPGGRRRAAARRSRPASPSAPCASGRSSSRIAVAQGFYGGGLIAAAPLFALVHVDRLNLSLADVGVIGILAAVATTVAFPLWGLVADRFGAVAALRTRQRDRPARRSSATPSRRASSSSGSPRSRPGSASASIDVGIAAAVSDQTPLASRAAAMAGWNALTGARGIVAAFLMSALLQIGLIDVTVGLLACAAHVRDRRRDVRPGGTGRSVPENRSRRPRPPPPAATGDASRCRHLDSRGSQLAAPPRRRPRRALADYDSAMRLTAWEEERLLIFAAAELARRHRAARPPPERARGDRADLRRDARGGPRGRLARGRRGGRARGRRARRGARRRPRARRRGPARGPASTTGRGWSCSSTRSAAARPTSARRAGRGRRRARRPRPAADAGSARSLVRPEHVAARRPRLVPLPVRSGQPAPRVRPAKPPPGSASTCPAGASERWAPGRDADGRARPVRRARPGRGGRRESVTRPLSPAERLARFGPTAGDRIRLGDTDLWIRSRRTARRPATSRSGATRKTIRPGMAQAGRARPSELDAVVAGAIVVDPTLGVVKADIGIKDGRVVGVGRAGQPGDQRRHRPRDRAAHRADHGLRADRDPGRGRQPRPPDQPGAHAGGAARRRDDAHHAPGSRSRRGRWSGRCAALEGWPLNVGLQAYARSTAAADLEALARGGRGRVQDPRGLRRDAGADRRDARVRRGGRDVSVALHTDGLHETAELEDTVAAIAGRTVHAYHVEGTGGGHVPDLLGPRARGERHLLVDDADDPVRRHTRRPSTCR